MVFVKRKSKVLAIFCVILLYTFYRASSGHRHGTKAKLVDKRSLLERELTLHKNWRQEGLNFQTAESARLPISSLLQEQLSQAFPYEPEKGFPKIIWQTWKVGLEDKSFPPKYRAYQASWETQNPSYKHYLVADEQCDHMVNELFSSVPDVAEAWNAMPKSILKADFFRYLILFARGGVYSDIDTVSLKPIDTWASHNSTLYGMPNNAGLVVGIEADPDRPDWAEWYARRIQFCQWTIQAKKGHPMLRDLIARITWLTLERKKNGVLAKVVGKDSGGDVMNWTGPGIFTDMVFAYMNAIMQTDHHSTANDDNKDHSTEKAPEEIITWELFTSMTVPIALEDVLVLPITCFSPGVNQMGLNPIHDPWAYVHHRFLGTWKGDKPKEH